MADIQEILKVVANGFSEGFNKVAKNFQEAIDNIKDQESEEKPQVLTAQTLQQLKWMNPRQLAAIYHYGKVKTYIEDDPNAYQQLKWMTEQQLQAIFGKDGMN